MQAGTLKVTLRDRYFLSAAQIVSCFFTLTIEISSSFTSSSNLTLTSADGVKSMVDDDSAGVIMRSAVAVEVKVTASPSPRSCFSEPVAALTSSLSSLTSSKQGQTKFKLITDTSI